MKYQIYLKKSTSETINGLAKAQGKKPSTFIKEFIEQCFDFTEQQLGEQATKEVQDYGKR